MAYESVRVIRADGENVELFDADYFIHKRADGTPSDIEIYNKSACFVIPSYRVEMLVKTSDDGEVSAYMRADRYTLGRANDGINSPVIWGWYSGTDW